MCLISSASCLFDSNKTMVCYDVMENIPQWVAIVPLNGEFRPV